MFKPNEKLIDVVTQIAHVYAFSACLLIPNIYSCMYSTLSYIKPGLEMPKNTE